MISKDLTSSVTLLVFLSLCDIRLSLPQTVGSVFIERLADYLLVKSVFGFSLAWDGGSGVYLKMSEEHQGAPCGLCGNFNHLAVDDLTTARGKTGPTGPSSSFLFSQHPLTAIIVIIHSTLILVNYSSSGTWRDPEWKDRRELVVWI